MPVLGNWRQVIGEKRRKIKQKNSFLVPRHSKTIHPWNSPNNKSPLYKIFLASWSRSASALSAPTDSSFVTYILLAPHIAKHLTYIYKSKIFVIFSTCWNASGH